MGPFGLCLRGAALLCAFATLSAADFTTFIGDTDVYRVARVKATLDGATFVAGSRGSGMFVMKLDAAGKIILFATLSGKGVDQVNDLAVDAAGNLYLAGSTTSPLLPLRAPLQSAPGPGFLVKFNADATQLLLSTYFPAAIQALAVDSSGNMYVTGATYSSSFPVTPGLPAGTVTPINNLSPTSAAFLTKITSSGDRIVYSTRISGHQKNCGAGSSCFLSSRSTFGVAVSVDSAGGAYLAGNTDTYDLPVTPGALLAQGTGAFVAKVNAAGSALDYLTYLGAAYFPLSPNTNPASFVSAIAADANGNAFLAGSTSDPAFPVTPGALHRTLAGRTDAFAAKLNANGSAMVWATYLGGAQDDRARAIAPDNAGNLWLSGTTASPDFPDPQGWSHGSDFLAGLNASGSALTYSSRFPDDTATAGIAVDGAGVLHFAGSSGLVTALTPSAAPAPRILGIANAAFGALGGHVSAGEVISLYGPGIGPATPLSAIPDASGAMPRSLGGVEVRFDDVPAALLYVSASQINAVAPLRFSTSAPRVKVRRNGTDTADFPTAVIAANVEVFQQSDGTAAAVNQDGSINSPEHPALPGSIVAIWATGIGAPRFNGWEDGHLAIAAADFDCCRIVASRSAPVVYGGAAPGIVAGVVQVNFQITSALAAYGPTVEFSLAAGDTISNPVRLYVRAPVD